MRDTGAFGNQIDLAYRINRLLCGYWLLILPANDFIIGCSFSYRHLPAKYNVVVREYEVILTKVHYINSLWRISSQKLVS